MTHALDFQNNQFCLVQRTDKRDYQNEEERRSIERTYIFAAWQVFVLSGVLHFELEVNCLHRGLIGKLMTCSVFLFFIYLFLFNFFNFESVGQFHGKTYVRKIQKRSLGFSLLTMYSEWREQSSSVRTYCSFAFLHLQSISKLYSVV